MEFAVTVVAMALNLLTSSRPTPDLGLDPKLLNVKDDQEVTRDGQSPVPSWSGELRETFLQQLPVAVLKFQHTPWDQVLPKVTGLLIQQQYWDYTKTYVWPFGSNIPQNTTDMFVYGIFHQVLSYNRCLTGC